MRRTTVSPLPFSPLPFSPLPFSRSFASAAACAFVLAAAVVGCGGAAPQPAAAPRASSLLATLQSSGLDPAKLPDSPKLLDDALRDRVMDSFTVSLGLKCAGCHDGVNYEASTPNKRVALGMWQHFVRGLKLAGGQPLWCDSCHQGRATFLDRSDDDALAAWMDANFVGKLVRSDGGKHACATCHGTPFDGHFLDGWQKGSVGG
ncbi:MAG: hypothetical protein JWN44_1609 [Myxococcales bacterium]|nr:hypothetical protein [Myxococcales bacterium]